MDSQSEYDLLCDNAWEIGFAHGLANHSRAETMKSCDTAVDGQCIPLTVWITILDGFDVGVKERIETNETETVQIDWTDVPY